MKICGKTHVIDGTEFCRCLHHSEGEEHLEFLWIPVKCIYGPWIRGRDSWSFRMRTSHEFAVFDSKDEFLDSAHITSGMIFEWEMGLCVMMDWPGWEETMLWIMDDRELGDIMLDPCKCPECGSGQIVERKSHLWRDAFYGCSEWPKCRYSFNAGDHDHLVYRAKIALNKAVFR